MPRPPKFDLPPGACDSHIHVYGEKSRFPSMPVNGREMEDHLLDDYIAVRDALGLSRTVIIQTPHYDNDNASMLNSIKTLGLENARGVAVLLQTSQTVSLKHCMQAVSGGCVLASNWRAACGRII